MIDMVNVSSCVGSFIGTQVPARVVLGDFLEVVVRSSKIVMVLPGV
jgi:protein tyrosine phosphatase